MTDYKTYGRPFLLARKGDVARVIAISPCDVFFRRHLSLVELRGALFTTGKVVTVAALHANKFAGPRLFLCSLRAFCSTVARMSACMCSRNGLG